MVPGASRTGSQPGRREYRQPERSSRRKKGALRRPARLWCGQENQRQERHILVITQGLLIHAIVRGADIQDRNGGVLLWRRYLAPSRFCSACTQIAVIKGRSFRRGFSSPLPTSTSTFTSKSSSAQTTAKALLFCPSDGSGSERSHDSTSDADWRSTGNTSRRRPSFSSTSPQSAWCYESSAIQEQTLSRQIVRN